MYAENADVAGTGSSLEVLSPDTSKFKNFFMKSNIEYDYDSGMSERIKHIDITHIN
jgi:hypothetical protein